jgi:hypothetical protein
MRSCKSVMKGFWLASGQSIGTDSNGYEKHEFLGVSEL